MLRISTSCKLNSIFHYTQNGGNSDTIKKGLKMEFPVKKNQNPNIHKYARQDMSKAYEFSKKLYDEFGPLVKAIVLFGSTSKAQRTNPGSDIDILIIIDDTETVLTRELIETYRIIVEKLIISISDKLHVTSLKLTTFWEYVRAGDPVGMNILRTGVALLDTGFFEPLRALLVRGRIRPSPEAIWTYFARAPRTIHNSKWHVLQGTLNLYWAVIDAAHAALMKVGVTPPSPEHVAEMIEEKLVKEKIVPRRYADIAQKFYKLQKDIVYREIKEVSGKEFDAYCKEAQEFVDEMGKVIGKR
ncbi:MAG: nucleotidyltransferase domain-containing protein [Candidatus Woesearchaeota archaeon]